LNIAEGSLSEIECLLGLTTRLNFLKVDQTLFDKIDEVARMLYALRTKVESTP
jgi:four helix bundle protein